jgi:hypothetical protein
MKRISDVRYLEPERVAIWLGRLCYPIALAIEVDQPAPARRLLESVFEARRCMSDLCRPIGTRARSRERKIQRALLAAKCTRAVLKRLAEEPAREAARITAAMEVAERFIDMLVERSSV